jgi:hypothetical protein
MGGGKASKKVKAAIHNERLLGEAPEKALAERVELVVHQQKPSMMAELRAALTSILFAGQNAAGLQGEGRPKALVFTSAGPGEELRW